MVCLRVVSLLSLLCILGVGCSRRPADMPPVYPCSITVVDNARPIEGAQVILEPLEGTLTVSVNGRTDASGVAVIRSNRLGAQYAENGAPAGTYRVLVTKQPKWSGEKTPDEVLTMNMSQSTAYVTAYNAAIKSLPREVPLSLSEKRTQTLEVVASGGGKLTVDVSAFK